MKMSFIATVAMAATAAAVGFAPIAAAAPTGTTTTNTGGATVVQSPGNAQVTAVPGVAATQAGELQYPFLGIHPLRPLELHHVGEHHSGGGESLPPIRPLTAVSWALRRHADGRPRDRSASHPDLGLVGGPRRRTARPERLRRRGIDGRRRRRGAAGGGGGGGAGSRLLVASSVDTAVVGAVSVTDVVASSTPPGLNTSRTAATTRAAAAVAAAINAISACFPRYHGAGAGSKYQVSESNASNAPSGTGSAPGTGSASVQKPSAGSSQLSWAGSLSPDV